MFKQLSEDFVIVGLKRKDKLKTLLSMGVWEELIHQGLFHKENITKSEMIEFHNQLPTHLSDPVLPRRLFPMHLKYQMKVKDKLFSWFRPY